MDAFFLFEEGEEEEEETYMKYSRLLQMNEVTDQSVLSFLHGVAVYFLVDREPPIKQPWCTSVSNLVLQSCRCAPSGLRFFIFLHVYYIYKAEADARVLQTGVCTSLY